MIAPTLARLIEEKLTTAAEVADLTGVAPSTVYRWVSGESEPDFESIRRLLRLLPRREAQEAVLAAFVAGTAWRPASAESDLDVNRDGKIDVNDALDACIRSVQPASESLTRVREACRDNVVTGEECAQLVALLNEVMRQCTTCERVLAQIAERRRKV